MEKRIRNLIALALAGFGLLVAATYRPFGGNQPGDAARIADLKDSGHWTGFEGG